jgi:hypothetical protein
MARFDPRRVTPRVRIDGLCGMLIGDDLRPASMADLSWTGLRLELPFDARTATRTLQLEIEVPEVDEIMWARGHVTHARLSPMGGTHADGQPRLWCSAGIHLEVAAGRDRRLLRDYVLWREWIPGNPA